SPHHCGTGINFSTFCSHWIDAVCLLQDEEEDKEGKF
ncbi:unnamed protein product, partial [Allacma fusca]